MPNVETEVTFNYGHGIIIKLYLALPASMSRDDIIEHARTRLTDTIALDTWHSGHTAWVSKGDIAID